MTFLIILAATTLPMSLETIRRSWRDGAGPGRPPLSHTDDPRFRSYSAR